MRTEERKLLVLLAIVIVAALLAIVQIRAERSGEPSPIAVAASYLIAGSENVVASVGNAIGGGASAVLSFPSLRARNAALVAANDDEVLGSLERFVIAPRAGVPDDALARVIAALPTNLRQRVGTLNLPALPESATLIRTLLAQGRSVRYLVPEAVWQYIRTHRLYGQPECER